MKKSMLNNLVIFTLAVVFLINIPTLANAASDKADSEQIKERLVVMPLRLDEGLEHLQGAIETSLVEGLQKKYEVFSGEQVAKKAHEIFMKESKNSAHTECDETRCLQGIAEAFQAELLAIANVTKQDQGYFLSLVIRNIFDNKVIYSKSIACETCNSYRAVDKMKELSGAVITATPNIIPPLYYVFADYGSISSGNLCDSTGASAMNAAGLYGVSATYSCSGSHSVYDIGLGYTNRNSTSILENFGIEIAYASLGAFSAETGPGATPSYVNATATAVLLPFTYTFNVTDKQFIKLRLGMALTNTKSTYLQNSLGSMPQTSSSTSADSGNAGILGIGYAAEVFNKVYVRVQLDNFGSIGWTSNSALQGPRDVQLFSAGVAYGF